MDVTAEANDFSSRTVLVLGDVMLDTWIYGHVERISPEAPVPVLRVDRRFEMLGGAGNVARNVAALGGRAILIGMCGDDAPGRRVAALSAEGDIDARLVISPAMPTPHKTRYAAASQQMLRVDEEIVRPAEAAVAQQIVDTVTAALGDVDAVILSDYAKGTLTDFVLAAVIDAARQAGKPVVADPKSRDLSRYRRVTVLTPNRIEMLAATGIECGDDAGSEAAGRRVLAEAEVDAVLVTRGADGLSIVRRDGPALHIPAVARSVFDVSGAGDTLVATLTLALCTQMPLPEAARLANTAAGVAVGKFGTAAVTRRELHEAVEDARAEAIHGKIAATDKEMLDRVTQWRRGGFRVGFTNGCFDLIHPGHVTLLAKARAACDRLIVGLNSDASVARLKGPSRPIQDETARATVIASIGAVDLVVIFAEDTPQRLVEAICPDVLIKGADYSAEEVVGGAFVTAHGGRVYLVPLEPEHSTTRTISRINTGRGQEEGGSDT